MKITKLHLYLFTLLSSLLIFNSCKKEYESIQSIDDRKIQEYISKNSLNMIKDPSGFYYQLVTTGTGGTIENKDSVFYTFDYKSLSGTTYYSSPAFSNSADYLGYLGTPYVSPANQPAYPGTIFRTLIGKVQRGGKILAIIPSYLAYGKNGVNSIPSNEVIVTDISVLTESKQSVIDDSRIQSFITSKSIPAIKHPSGVYYVTSVVGTGAVAIKPISVVKVKYTGRFLDGKVFDQTTGDNTLETGLSGLIPGWQKVLVGYTAGTKIRLIIPSILAYGADGDTTIPQNSVLDFDIEIITVTGN